MKKVMAEISPQTARAMKKLRKQWDEESAQITPEALQKTKEKIRNWIAEHVKVREHVAKTAIGLFNHNADPAKMSQKTQNIAKNVFSQYNTGK